MGDGRRFYEAPSSGQRRSAPAAQRNREPIAEVLRGWLPPHGVVLEIASGTGEHAVHFAAAFPSLDWQPSDIHPDALRSIEAWRSAAALPNLRAPIVLDAAAADWPVAHACGHNRGAAENRGVDVVLNLNMVHISPWRAALGLLNGAARALKRGGALILYGPWLKADIETAPGNLEFDRQLRERDREWGLRRVEDFEAEASARGFVLEQVHRMPANNLMLLFRLSRAREPLL